MIVRVTIAGQTMLGFAERVEKDSQGLAATLFETLGVSKWGVEAGVTAEFAGASFAWYDTLRTFVVSVLRRTGETCAYVTIDGLSAELWFADGRVGPIE